VTAGARIERRYAFDPFALTSGASTTWSGASPSALPASTTLQFRMIAPRAVSVQIAAGRPALVGSPAQRVMAYAGPWRIDEGWWAPAGRPAMRVARDEYDVLLEDGTLVRIARERTAWSVRGIYD
jgi:protein ImuB